MGGRGTTQGKLEPEFTAIPHEIVEAFARTNLSPYESRVVWFICRKTFGWHKKTDYISLSQFALGTGIDRRNVHRTLKGLESRKIVVRRDDRKGIRYGIQRDFTVWKVSSVETPPQGVVCRDDKVVSVEMTELSSVETPTKEKEKKLTKERAGSAGGSPSLGGSPASPGSPCEDEYFSPEEAKTLLNGISEKLSFRPPPNDEPVSGNDPPPRLDDTALFDRFMDAYPIVEEGDQGIVSPIWNNLKVDAALLDKILADISWRYGSRPPEDLEDIPSPQSYLWHQPWNEADKAKA
jgi:phage replication O-like protein O